MITKLKKFLEIEAASGMLMIISACLALILANSNISDNYFAFINCKILSKSLHVWVNELLMSFFFMLVGLEIKSELTQGQLKSRDQIILPLIATIAGVIFPAIIFCIFNYNHTENIRGWAIPTVTDIAFAICILSFFTKSIHPYLRVFLLSLAIFDDLIGIIIIALFYTKTISLYYLLQASLIILLMLICNRKSVRILYIYMILGSMLWYFLLKSGIHATISGVVTAFFTPIKCKNSPFKRLVTILHPWVAYLIIPLFAFVNSGIKFSHFHTYDLNKPLPLGIIFGLFIGKQFGVFFSIVMVDKMKLVIMPRISWAKWYGVSILAGIGYTVSLFIGELSFEDEHLTQIMKISVLTASVLSAIWGSIIMRMSTSRKD